MAPPTQTLMTDHAVPLGMLDAAVSISADLAVQRPAT